MILITSILNHFTGAHRVDGRAVRYAARLNDYNSSLYEAFLLSECGKVSSTTIHMFWMYLNVSSSQQKLAHNWIHCTLQIMFCVMEEGFQY